MDFFFSSQSATWGEALVYRWMKSKYDPLTQWARSAFENILLTPKNVRSLYGTSNTFIPHRAAQFDITLLLDMSFSMGDLKETFCHNPLTNEVEQLESDSGMSCLFPVLLVMAEALNGLKGINLEILGFSADCRLISEEVGYGFNKGKASGGNIVYIIKSFTNKNTGERMERLNSLCSNSLFSAWNYNIGALKTAASRLKAYPSGNQKLLIVLSDCMPNSSHIPYQETAVRLTRNTIAELEKIIGVFGIGINTDATRQLFTNHAVADGPYAFFIIRAVKRICSFMKNLKKEVSDETQESKQRL